MWRKVSFLALVFHKAWSAPGSLGLSQVIFLTWPQEASWGGHWTTPGPALTDAAVSCPLFAHSLASSSSPLDHFHCCRTCTCWPTWGRILTPLFPHFPLGWWHLAQSAGQFSQYLPTLCACGNELNERFFHHTSLENVPWLGSCLIQPGD
jgi:hypothetical protein